MREFWIKVLRRSIPVAIVLGIMGYIFAEGFLTFARMNGGITDPANDAVRWRTPLTMAIMGVSIQITIELFTKFLRRKPALPNAEPAKSTIPATGQPTSAAS
jgi:hypothetical protein